jgi:putative intracellular protease/amidase
MPELLPEVLDAAALFVAAVCHGTALVGPVLRWNAAAVTLPKASEHLFR